MYEFELKVGHYRHVMSLKRMDNHSRLPLRVTRLNKLHCIIIQLLLLFQIF